MISKLNKRVFSQILPPMTYKYDGFIDLRSDTITKPSDKMKKAMMECEVGDDMYKDDPTVDIL